MRLRLPQFFTCVFFFSLENDTFGILSLLASCYSSPQNRRRNGMHVNWFSCCNKFWTQTTQEGKRFNLDNGFRSFTPWLAGSAALGLTKVRMSWLWVCVVETVS